jgi:hypothetical protein
MHLRLTNGPFRWGYNKIVCISIFYTRAACPAHFVIFDNRHHTDRQAAEIIKFFINPIYLNTVFSHIPSLHSSSHWG